MTRPLRAVTSAMRDVAATGDLTRKVTVRSRAWDDEDARLLASAFNTLTDSIARFQREAAQKERLSSLGRLSTVDRARDPQSADDHPRLAGVAAARPASTPPSGAKRVADIDEETTRLNRIVTEVLDFAKPIRFDLGEAARQRHLPRLGGGGVGRASRSRRSASISTRRCRRSSPTPSGCAPRSSTS